MALVAPVSCRTLHKVSFGLPSGLLVVDNIDSSGASQHICLLQHNVVSLRLSYCRAKELKYAVSPKECAKIIRVAEEYASCNGGWTNKRHTHHATTDIPIELLFGEDSYIDELVNSSILPEIAAFFDLDGNQLHIGELFVVKYEFQEGHQVGLPPHVDGTPWSFVIALNDCTEYAGGGTRFIESQVTYRPQKAGSAVLFSGKNLHEGVALTGGMRYILTGFCEYVHNCSELSPQEAFMKTYDAIHDGFAAQGGVCTGDVIKGIFDPHDQVHYVDGINTLHVLLEEVGSAREHLDFKFSLLVERLSIDDFDLDSEDGNKLLKHDYVDTGTDSISTTAGAMHIATVVQCEKKLEAENRNIDDGIIHDIIQHSDLFLSVGQFWKFDDR